MIGCCAYLAGCAAQSPAAVVDRKAVELGFARELLQTEHFRHVIYRRAPATDTETLHIYIEGDGLPFIDRNVVTRDPTPATPVMLELMSMDPVASVYLGRPCYFGLAGEPPCHPYFWTNGRYAEEVVASVAEAIRQLDAEYGEARNLRLFGHSGGGSLALLAGIRIDEVNTIVTIGANLDIDAWAEHHNYTPLEGSLNPVDLQTRSGVRVVHLAGADDEVAPPALVLGAGEAMSHEVRVVPGVGHSCCWAETWIDVLSELSASPSGTASDSAGRK